MSWCDPKKFEKMRKSGIPEGQMFIHFNPTYMDRPRVWVKVGNQRFGNFRGEDKEEVSLFVNNDAMVKAAINPAYEPDLAEKWSVTDGYYNRMVAEGEFVPIDDLKKVDGICLRLGWPDYTLDL